MQMDAGEKDGLNEALAQYEVLMAEGAYFEAHEALEVVWYPMRRDRSALANSLRGLINGAVAFEHLKRGRSGAEERARRVMASYDRTISLRHSLKQEYPGLEGASRQVERLKEICGEVFDVSLS